jgi:NhaC family Na+:H+ antiporter
MSATLGVSTFAYFPYCFFNFIDPILAMIFGFAGINVQRLKPEEQPALETLAEAPLVDLAP